MRSVVLSAGVAFASLALLTGCPPVDPPNDGGVVEDSGVADGGANPDGGVVDGGENDGGIEPVDGGGGGDRCNEFAFPFENPPLMPSDLTEDDAWKRRVGRDDAFFAATPYGVAPALKWIKFAVLASDPTFVIFQDSNRYAFHYEFAEAHLPDFDGMTPAEFDDVTLHEDGQQLILGAVVMPQQQGAGLAANEIGIQLVRHDPLHPEQTAQLLQLVQSSLDDVEGADFFYFPTFEQQCVVENYATYFGEQGIDISSADRWADGDGCYVSGWAVGRLQQVEASRIDDAYVSGELLPTDILVTDEVPAEIPYVAGVISLAPSTPNSHVALLAQQYGTPFVYARTDDAIAAVNANLGNVVALDVGGTFETACSMTLVDLTDVDGTLVDGLLGEKTPPAVDYVPKATLGAITDDTADLGPDDVEHFGGKASMFGLLRDAIPDNSPDAVGFSFDLYDAFMAQPHATTTLGEAITAKLSAHTYPPNMEQLHIDLDEVRGWIKDARIPAELQPDVLAALDRFDANRRVRFRSSTNVEDGVSFVGAGLYDSKSGCIADDTDDDDVGPSICNAAKADERGVFRAISRVYASFYNDNAFLERLRRGVDESEVGMAILAHHSFPDEDELANGVATVTVGSFSTNMVLVTQDGAVSVTNPDSSAIPEVVDVYVGSGGMAYPEQRQGSSLLPLGATVLDEGEYEELALLLTTVADHFESVTQTGTPFVLDFEYKKMRDAGLVVKQVRQLPPPGSTGDNDVRLVDAGVELCLFQGEYGNALANHRLKMRLQLTHDDVVYTPDTFTETFLQTASITTTQLIDDAIATVVDDGDVATWPGNSISMTYDHFTQHLTWRGDELRLEFALPTTMRDDRSPVQTLADGIVYATHVYATPKPGMGGFNGDTVDSDTVRLQVCDDVTEPAVGAIERNFDITDTGVTVNIHMWYPPNPTGPTAGYTAPLHMWEDITITGLTTTPMVLQSHASRTFRPGHHNFTEDFLFEPQLDANVSQAQLDELAAADIQLIWVEAGYQEGVIRVMGADGSFREWE